MKCTVLLVIGICVAAVLDVSESKVTSDRAELCELRNRWGRRYPNYRRRWRYDGSPFRRSHHLRIPKKQPLPSSCKRIECPTGELCHLIRPQCYDPPCQLVPICVKKDKSGEWIDSEEWMGESPVVDKGFNHRKDESNVASDSEDLKDKNSDVELPYQNPVFTDGLKYDEEPQTEATATNKNPTEIEAAEVPQGYVNPGGPEIPAQSVNPNNYDATQGPVVNSGNPEIPAESVSTDNSKISVHFLSLNNSESSRSPDNSGDRIKSDGQTNTRMHKHKYHPNSRKHYLPGAYPEDLRMHKNLNTRTQRRHQRYRRKASE